MTNEESAHVHPSPTLHPNTANMPGLMTTIPFPQDVPTHPLVVVDYALIALGHKQELDKLWKAAIELGFW